MVTLVSLIPRPIKVENGSIAGKLRVDGNIENNVIQFRFRFTNTDETAPVCLNLYAAGKIYRFYCTIFENNPKEIVTPVFNPEFAVGQCFYLTGIEPLIRFSADGPNLLRYL